MVKRQQSSGNLLPKRSVSFDHGITAAFLLIFGCFGLALGGTMTGLSYGYEKRDGFTSVVLSCYVDTISICILILHFIVTKGRVL